LGSWTDQNKNTFTRIKGEAQRPSPIDTVRKMPDSFNGCVKRPLDYKGRARGGQPQRENAAPWRTATAARTENREKLVDAGQDP